MGKYLDLLLTVIFPTILYSHQSYFSPTPTSSPASVDPDPFTINPFLDVIDFSLPGLAGSLPITPPRQPEVVSVRLTPGMLTKHEDGLSS